MAALGRLVAELALDSAQFTEGLKRAQKGLDDFRASINGVAGAALGSFAGQLIALETASRAADASIRAFTDTVKGLSALDDASEKTGATVENLSRLEAQSIISGQAFGALEGALIKLNKGLVDADEETKGAGKALEYLGVAARDANGNLKDAAEITEEVAKKLSEFSDKGPGKAALALALYGKAGAELLPYLKDLADAGDLVTTVTAKQASEAENYEKGLKRLGLVNLDLKRQVVSEILPVANQFIESLINQKKAGDGLQKTIKELTEDGSIRRWTENSIVFVGQVIDVARAIPTAFKMAGVFIAGLAVEAVTAGEVLYNVAKAITSVGNGAAQAEGINNARAALAKLGQGAAFAQEDFDKLADSFTKNSFADKFRSAFGQIEGAMDRANKKIADFKPASEKASKEAEAFAKALESLLDKLNGKDAGVDSSFRKEVETLVRAQREGKISTEQYAEAIQKLARQQPVNIKLTKEMEEATKDLAKAAEEEYKLMLKNVPEISTAYEDLWTSMQKQLEASQEELRLFGLTGTEREKALVDIKLQAALTKELTDVEKEALIVQAEKLKASIDARGASEAAAKSLEEQLKNTQALQDNVAGFFENLFLNGKKAFDDLGQTVKRFFAQLAAQMAAKYVLQIGASLLGLGGAGGANAAGLLGNIFGGGGGFNLGSIFGGGGGGIFGTVGADFGIESVAGSGLAGLLGDLGLTSIATGVQAAGAGLIANLSTLGTALTSGITAAGGFATVLGSAIPVIGAIVAIASALGVFTNETGIKIDNSVRDGRGRKDIINSALGAFDVSGDIGNEAFKPLIDRVNQLDSFIADNLLSPEALAVVKENIQRISSDMTDWFGFDDEASAKIAIEKSSKLFLQQRYSVAFDALEAGAGDLIRSFEGTADELLAYIAKLSTSAYAIGKLNDAVPGLNLTIAAFSKLTDKAQEAFTALALSIDAFNTDTNQTVTDILDAASRGVVTSYQRQADAVLLLRDGLASGSVSIEDFAAGIGNLATAYAQATAKIAETKQALAELFGNTQEGFLLQSLSAEEKYAYYQQQAEALYAQLANATDPETIDRLARKIDSLQNAAFGLLSPEQQAALSGQFISGSQRVEDLVNARLAAAGDLLDKQNESLRDVIRDALAEFAAKINDVADKDAETADINRVTANTPRRLDIVVYKNGDVEVGQV